MARSRSGGAVQSKIQMILYGAPFTGKSTLAVQSAYLKRPDGKPFRVLYIDPESGSIDDYLPGLEADGIDLQNIYIVYTQSLSEVRELIERAKNGEPYYYYDDDGNETSEAVLDADGEMFNPDMIVVDGASVLNLTTKNSIVEFSKKRASVKAKNAGLVGDEKFVKVEGAGLELKDYQTINFKGQELILDLMGCGKHFVVTARETDERVTKEINGKEVSVSTGEKIPDGFKNMDYNTKTCLRMYRDPNDYEIVRAFVRKDRSGVHKAGEDIEDPSLLDYQELIDRTAKNRNFVIHNTIQDAIKTEERIYAEEIGVEPDANDDASGSAASEASTLKDELMSAIKKMSPPMKSSMKKQTMEAGLPTNFKNVDDVDTLKKILEIVKNASA